MWEHENETLQPKEYLYPPVSPSLSRGYTEPPPSKPPEKPTVRPVKAEESNKESAPKSAPKQSSSATPDVNYLFLAQLVVCLAVIGFVILMQKTNHEFYLQMGQEYKAALEQGVEITGDHDLLKFTEEAVAQVRDAAQEMLDSNTTEQGAGGWNPTSSQNQPPEGFSLQNCTLKQTPTLPLEQFTVTSEYGFRKHPITGESDFHGGLDLAAAEGTPILSVLPGIVLQVGTSNSYGNYVKVLHQGNLVSTYNHMQGASVKQGQMIQQGQQVGTVGSTGVSTGPHLHLEFLLNGIRVNPALSLEISE